MDQEDGNNDRIKEPGKAEKQSVVAGDSKPAEKPADAVSAAPRPPQRMAEHKVLRTGVQEADFSRLSRRGLLKVAPVLVLGAFAVPSLQALLLKRGLGFSDWASKQLFRRRHFAPTFRDSELTPFE